MSERVPDMVEKVARAIAPDAFNTSHAEGTCPYCDADRERARGLARAALEAMREPTEGMVVAGGYELQEHVALTQDAFLEMWTAAIDAALRENAMQELADQAQALKMGYEP